MLIATLLFFSAMMRLMAIGAASQTSNPFVSVRPDTAEEIAYWEARDRAQQAGPNYKTLRMLCDTPGVDRPELLCAASADLSDSTAVVGVVIGDHTFAFDLGAMQRVESHIVNLVVDRIPVSVTYCDLTDCVRVLTQDSESLIPIRVGGLDVDDQLVFLLGRERYSQGSSNLPLDDHPFTRTSFGEWKRRHPTTRVYIGNKTARIREA